MSRSNKAPITAGQDGGRKTGKKTKKDLNHKKIGGSDMDAFIDDKENETVDNTDAKPPLPPSASERPAVEKAPPASVQDTKPTDTPSYAAAVDAEAPKSKEPSPQLPAPTGATSESQQPPAEIKSVSVPESEQPPVKDTAAAAPATVKEPAPPAKNQKQHLAEPHHVEPAATVESAAPERPASPVQPPAPVQNSWRSPPVLSEPQRSQPKDNIPPQEVETPAPTTVEESSTYNDENKPPKEVAPVDQKQRGGGDEDKQSGLIDGKEDASQKVPDNKMTNAKKDAKDKLQYDRAYLMELRDCLSSQTKPEGLPNLEIILDKPVDVSRGATAEPMDFTPAFFHSSGSNQRHAAQIGKSNSRSRVRPGEMQMMPRIIKTHSMQSDAKLLHQTEKPWKPKVATHATASASTGDQADKPGPTKTLESEVLYIMNRLTPTNFERLAEEMKKLPIKTYDNLMELVNIFFDKVTMETKFVTAYALLCKVISLMKVPAPPNHKVKESQTQNQAVTFRVVMLTKCQQEFEADKSNIFEPPEEKKKKMEAELPDTPDKQEQIENALYQLKLRRLKFYGNIRFIGELFKLGMLTETIMHDCIYRLLKAGDDDSLVSLCQLITTVGRELDTDKAKTRMDQYFVQMAKLSKEKKSRIKFTLKDAIDLRSNNWVPRKEQIGPKKIEEIHKDHQQEQARNQYLNSQPPPPRNDMQQPGSRRGSRQRQEEKPNDDGWNTVGSKSLRIDVSKMKLTKNVMDENNIQLGPGGGLNKFSMWSRGSYGGAQPSQDSDRLAPAGNRFSALRNDEDRRNFQRSPSRGDGGPASRGVRQGPTAGHGRGMARSSQEGERRDLLSSARTIVRGGRSQNSSRDNSWNREDRRQSLGPRGSREGENPMTRSDISLRPNTEEFRTPSAPAPSKKPKMSEKEMEHKAKTILEEYLSIRDLAEAKLCVSELMGEPHLPLLVTASINDVLEQNNQARDLTGQFFHELIKTNTITVDTYTKGFAEVLKFAEDMVIDIPMLWNYLAQVITPTLIGGSLPWSKLTGLLKPNLTNQFCTLLLAAILQNAKEKTSETAVAQFWQSGKVAWTDFLQPDEVDAFLGSKGLAFTTMTVPAADVTCQANLTKLADDVELMIRAAKTNADIFAYVDKNVPVEERDKNFVRSVTTAVASSSISRETMKANVKVIKERKDVLIRYITTRALEVQALYAIQALMARLEHPSGVIGQLFTALEHEEVVTEEAFNQWETSSDSQEQEGKGACSMQLTQFFAWLRENDEPEGSS